MDNYERLREVLTDAVKQAAYGKGKERHANDGEPFEKQLICEIGRRVGLGYNLGQAIKKIVESRRLPPGRDIAELLGAINYIAAAVILLREDQGQVVESMPDYIRPLQIDSVDPPDLDDIDSEPAPPEALKFGPFVPDGIEPEAPKVGPLPFILDGDPIPAPTSFEIPPWTGSPQ